MCKKWFKVNEKFVTETEITETMFVDLYLK